MPQLLTTQEAADVLGVTRRRVLAMIRAGQIPAARFGASWAIRPADVERVRDRKPGRPATKRQGMRKRP